MSFSSFRTGGAVNFRPTATAAVLQALVVAFLLACVAPAAQATEYRYHPVHVTDRTATFAVGGLAGRNVVSARLETTGAKVRWVRAAIVRRAASRTRRLRVTLPSTPGLQRTTTATSVTLRVRTRRPRNPAPAPTPTPTPPPPPATTPPLPQPGTPIGFGSVLWKADAESTMAEEWASNSSIPAAVSPPNPDPSRIAQNTFRAQGQRSYRFEMRAGDDSYGARAELGQGMPTIARYEDRWFHAGEDRWIAMQYYLPAEWPSDDTWQTIMQLKPVDGGGGGPSIGLDAGGNKLKIYGNSNTWGSTQGNFFDGAGSLAGGAYPLTKGHWIKLTWHVVFSADPAVGSLEVFGDLGDGGGMRTLAPRHNRATMKYLNGAMDPAHLRVGIYRDPTMTATANLFVDGVTVATTRAAAEANAYATS
jgi:hypothetical protein